MGARVAFWVDDHLYGWRRLLFTLLALLTACAYAAGAWLYAICLVALALVVYALLLARVWSLRDDDENWTWDHVRSQIRVSLGQLELPAISEIPRVVGSWLLTVGATTLATVPAIAAVAATLLRLASRSIDNETVRTWIDYGMWLAAIATALGTILYVRWWYRTHLSPHRLKLSRSLASEQVLFNAWRDNPTAFTSDRALQSVLGVLQSWRPRGCRLEKEYEASLVRHLRRRLPNLEVEQQHPLYHEGTRVGKVDIVIGGAFAFELKRAVTASEGDRAVGQVWKYLLTWEKGPVALLLCETRENKTEDLVAARLTELRGQQKPVMVIAAGKRLD
ncbi:MAG: hypothetical protein H6717_42300 [Polyangiaceae bacterium]|nr:hypothetical protein [Polyangiaceae bacterium]